MTSTAISTAATLPVVRALLDEAKRKRFAGGVLGVRARPEWNGPETFEHNGTDVRVVICSSALAMREALLDRAPDRWLVLLTDRDETELGLGITAHLTWQRLRQPDPWAAVQDRFAATRIDRRLVDASRGRDLAGGLLAATPAGGWPPARAGLLTADHVFNSVATALLQLGRPGEPLDLTAILRWTTRNDAATAIADLRAVAGDALVDPLLDWLGDRCGSCGQAIGPLLREGRAADIVPLGLVARAVIATETGSGPRALFGREVGTNLGDHILTAWSVEAEAITRDVISGDQHAAAAVLARAETLLDRTEAAAHAADSAVLRRALTARLAALGETLRRCANRAPARAASGGPDVPLVDAALLPEIENRRAAVEAHALARHSDEVRVPRALAAVRLTRWLAQPATPASDLATHMARHRDDDAWADRAAADAWSGVEDETLAQGLRAVLGAARLRRDPHDTAFADALAIQQEHARPTPAGFVYIEHLLATTVLPLARQQPVLLVVADGMSQAVATEIVDDVVRRYESWLECLPSDRDRRLVAISALPSLTKVCRASLFAGELTTGEQPIETAAFNSLAKAHKVSGRLFHKLSLDTSEAGFALAHNVRLAIDDVTGIALVACVLNTIDDALDRSDPGGIDWISDAVKHLRPLLERARQAGRVIVLTSDHGHVVERREGRLVPAASMSSNRSRPFAGGGAPGEGEVRVRGPRVLLHDGDAVLAADERLRYGPLKAGYHGGAAPAEVVVPVVVLAPGEAPAGWRLAPPQSPAWWRGPITETAPAVSAAITASALPKSKARPGEAPTLFDSAEVPRTDNGIGATVLASPVYLEQRKRAARLRISDQQIRTLLEALFAAPDNRLDPESVAAVLGVATVQLSGAFTQAQRLLNVEQYAVLTRDGDGVTIVLDVGLLREQFQVSG